MLKFSRIFEFFLGYIILLRFFSPVISHPHPRSHLHVNSNKDQIVYQDFTFVVSHFNSSRQYGKCLNMIVKYRYQQNQTSLPKDLEVQGYFLDYREVRDMALKYAQPLPSPSPLSMPAQWELVNQVFAEDVMKTYENRIVAISSQIQVLSQSDRSEIHEPGTHGSIVTIDKTPYALGREDNSYRYTSTFLPLNEPWLNSFQYDCTLENKHALDNL